MQAVILEQKIGKTKQKFGEDAYRLMVMGDREGTEALFTQVKDKIQSLEAQLASKREGMAILKVRRILLYMHPRAEAAGRSQALYRVLHLR